MITVGTGSAAVIDTVFGIRFGLAFGTVLGGVCYSVLRWFVLLLYCGPVDADLASFVDRTGFAGLVVQHYNV